MKRYWQPAALILAGAVSAVVFMHFLQGNRGEVPAQQVAQVPHVEPMPMTAPVSPADTPVATPADGGTPLGGVEPPKSPKPVTPPSPVSKPVSPAPKPKSVPAVGNRNPAPVTEVAHRNPAPPAPTIPVTNPEPAPVTPTPSPSNDPDKLAPRVDPAADPGLAPVVNPAPVVDQPVAPPAPAPPRTVTIPAGTLFSVRLNESVGSDRNQPGDTFTAVLDSELVVNGLVIAERGARTEGRVVQAQAAGRVKGLSNISIELTELVMSDGQRVRIQTESFEKQGERSTGDDAAKMSAGAAIGAILGAITGGGSGAAIGAAIGGATGAGGVLLTRGKPVTLPAETRISFRLRNAVTVTEKKS